MPEISTRWRAFGLVAVLAVAVHAWSLTFDFSRVDDDILIIDRASFLNDWAHVRDVFSQGYFPSQHESPHFYRPLVTASFMLDARAPITAASYHRTNVILHVLASLLLLGLLLSIGTSEPVAALGGAVFAVHPAVTSTVDWIPGRNDSLLACFIFAAWICLERWRAVGRTRFLILHALLFLAALLCKETAVVAPALWLLTPFLLKGTPPTLREGWLLAVWGTVITTWGALRAAVPERSVPFPEQLAAAMRHPSAVLIYLGKLVLPARLSILANENDSSILPGVFAALVLIAAIWTSANRRRALLGAAMVLLFLSPALLVRNGLVLENRLYLPLAGALLIGTAWMESRPLPSNAFAGASAGLLVLLGARTLASSADYRTRLSVGEACIRTAPSLSLSHMTAGNALEAAGDTAAAEKEFRRALEIDPRSSVGLNNVGVLALRRNAPGEAERDLRAAIAIDPTYARAHFNLGLALRAEGNLRDAAAELNRAVELDPERIESLGELLATYAQLGDTMNVQRVRAEMERQGVRFIPEGTAPTRP
jgi:tetratricopeptide (TPR) repeat protein